MDNEAGGPPDSGHLGEHVREARAFVVERFLLQQLLRMARQMNGDFESMMILGVLRLQKAARSLAQTPTLPQAAAMLNDLLPERLLQQPGLRSSDLSHVTGVPRETVRRKLERLQADGRVRRHDDGRWHASEGVAPPHAFNRDTLENFGATADLITALPR